MQPDEDFWDDLLAHLAERQLVAVVGPELVLTNDGARLLPLNQLIGERLAARYKLTLDGGAPAGLDAAVRACLAARGRDQQERLYRVVNDLLAEIDPQPGPALKTLARVTDLQLFISTTFDDLLARAIDEVRFAGRRVTQQRWFSPNQSTAAQQQNALRPGDDPVVFKLFGEVSSVPQYAIHEEDTLEWLHALLSQTAHLPDWVDDPLKMRPLLLLGCQLPDWIGRFLVRMASAKRLSVSDKQFFVVGANLSRQPELTSFFHSYCSPTRVQLAEMDPAAFVAELHRRWLQRQPVQGAGAAPVPADAPTGSIFISYVREDADAARHLAQQIEEIGGDVWLDQRRLQPGDQWEPEILSGIRRGVRLFLPLISQQTEARSEGYVFKEWAEAVERAKGIPPSRRFIIPVIVDERYDGNPAKYRQVPEPFMQMHFGWAPGGRPGEALVTVLRDELRAMRRA